MKIFKSLTELVGETPLLELCAIEERMEVSALLLAKLEYFNPLGSTKDRAALFMMEAAERRGELGEGAVVVESTSGNTGIGLAWVCAVKGYKLILTMPESMSAERRGLLTALGAHLELTPAAEGMAGAVKAARRLASALPRVFLPSQFDNPDNADAHYKTTGPEIWRDTGGNVDILVAGVGTGGTITGAGRFLKEQNPAIRVVAVEPASSPFLSEGETGPHGLQGIGAGFLPGVLARELIDEIITVSDDDAYEMTRRLSRAEGLFVGISSGAAVQGAVTLARRGQYAGKTMVIILPDIGERYLSTGVHQKNSNR